MKIPTLKHPLTAKLAVLSAVIAAFINTGQAVTLSQVTNGLVSFYPLDFVVTNGSTVITYDYVNARDMVMLNMNGTNKIASTRPTQNSLSVSNCLDFNQQAGGLGTTIMYYQSKGQGSLPLDGSGDFLPFCNQINATMNFWIKCTASTNINAYNDKRFFGEADDGNGQNAPLFLFGTSSGGGLPTDRNAHFLLRQDTSGSGTNSAVDGTFQTPNFNAIWAQGNNYTASNGVSALLDGDWHMFTMTVDTNRVIDIYIDGVRNPGPPGPAFTDAYGNPTYGQAVPLTNTYYANNIYPPAGVSNPPPNGFVRWVFNGMFTKGVTAFGGFRRNGGNTGGFPMLYDDIGFWNRQLSQDEIEFVRTNGLYNIPVTRPLSINSFTADFPEAGTGDTVTLRWNLTGVSTNTGSIVISGVGDVTGLGAIASTSVTLSSSQQTFTMIAQPQSLGGPKTNSVTVKGFAGVSSDWHLIERFDGTYSDTASGLNANNWISAGSDFSGSFDKWNVLTVVNSGASNKVLTPRTGYLPNGSSLTGFESRGALAYAKLSSLSMSPGQTNTLFFRFSLQEPVTNSAGLYSDLDFGVGLTDYNFIGPSGGLGYYGGTGGGLGAYFSILRDTGGSFSGGPINLFAPDTADATEGNAAGSFNYTALHPGGLETNVNYLVWVDVVARQTAADTSSSTTTNQALYSVWLQKQGEPTRTLLFTNFHGNRNYVGFNPVNDNPTPTLDRVFFNIGNESFVGAAAGSYTTTNMIAIDDVYLSKSGVKGTVPRLFDITSIVKGPSSVTLNWDSLGSLYGTNTYSIVRSANISGPWTPLATIPSGGATTTYTDNTIGAGTAAYYRIVWP